MHIFHGRRLTYANVTATLALVFSMSGGAIAANHYLISSTKQISPKILKKLKGKTGSPGKTGATGPTGAQGVPGKEGIAGKSATIPALTWTPLTLENGWAEYGFYGVPSYTKDVEGFVHLSGAIDGTKQTKALFATLPAGFRPTRSEYVWLRAASTNGGSDPHLVDIQIESSTGKMEAYNGPGSTDRFVSLEGVTFYAG